MEGFFVNIFLNVTWFKWRSKVLQFTIIRMEEIYWMQNGYITWASRHKLGCWNWKQYTEDDLARYSVGRSSENAD